MPPEAKSTQENSAAGPSNSRAEAAFIASDSFTGARDGYVFKKDECGLGYYRDVPLAERLKAAAEAQKAKHIVVKANNSLLKSLQKRGPPLPVVPSGAAKKSKTDDNKDAPKYLKEMERYKQMSCSSDTKHDRPLVK